jgi:aspartate/methionine/tyrosine aminotransferase
VLTLLRETGILCVNGSGFGVPPADGFFRVVFLANPTDLEQIFADISSFTREYLARG